LLEELKKFPKPAPLPLAMALQNTKGAPAKRSCSPRRLQQSRARSAARLSGNSHAI
jgi:hypothetical protein